MQVQSTHIVLIGLPGSGKSAIGFSAARGLGRPFFDVNAMSESPSIHHLPTDEAHDVVADAEREWFERIVATSGRSIIAAPWSAIQTIVDRRPQGVWIVFLDVSVEAAEARLGADDADRSLHDRLEHLATEHASELDDARQVADVRIDTDGRTVEAITDELRAAWSAADHAAQR